MKNFFTLVMNIIGFYDINKYVCLAKKEEQHNNMIQEKKIHEERKNERGNELMIHTSSWLFV